MSLSVFEEEKQSKAYYTVYLGYHMQTLVRGGIGWGALVADRGREVARPAFSQVRISVEA